MADQPTFFISEAPQPLAARMRPQTLDEIVGQKRLLGEGKILRRLVENDAISSMIFWGPPGVGKTTLAYVIARLTKSKFIDFSAVTSGIKEIREVMQEADRNRAYGQRTILFVDEIHRFNKAQQDAFLPFVEKGSIVLIGATTENPSFEVNSALLSRCKVFVLDALTEDEIVELLTRALTSPKGFGAQKTTIAPDVLRLIATFSNGDARTALSTLEMAVLNGEQTADGASIVSRETVEQCTSRKSLLYDKNGEEHYNLISALHKSMRNSDADASLYWLARMLEAGEDPLYIARRVVRFASEDVGMADTRALQLAVAAFQGCQFIGMPECTTILAEAVVYMALAPKSNAVYVGYGAARHDALATLSQPVPLRIRNAVTNLMRDVGYGKGYQYAHDMPDKIADMQCLPDAMLGTQYYKPTTEGFERNYGERYYQIREWKEAAKKRSTGEKGENGQNERVQDA
ncbi:MAG: replication-associated recombination protein A [Thermoguttaceae bacterium]|nr:replication-associated recombination protein A [Thermoguttaceae bacterium]